jgi:hypothetical protein
VREQRSFSPRRSEKGVDRRTLRRGGGTDVGVPVVVIRLENEPVSPKDVRGTSIDESQVGLPTPKGVVIHNLSNIRMVLVEHVGEHIAAVGSSGVCSYFPGPLKELGQCEIILKWTIRNGGKRVLHTVIGRGKHGQDRGTVCLELDLVTGRYVGSVIHGLDSVGNVLMRSHHLRCSCRGGMNHRTLLQGHRLGQF